MNRTTLKEHSLRLLQREHLDIGLTTLRFEPHGALFALASSGGTRRPIALTARPRNSLRLRHR